MNHLILGAGNLGIDLRLALESAGHNVKILKRKHFNYPSDNVGLLYTYIKGVDVDIIWNCIGCGSVSEGHNDITKQFMESVGLTHELSKEFSNKTIITFSSDYAREPVSIYGLVKSFQDQLTEFKDNVRSIRVTSLYGSHHPEKGLPWRLLVNNLNNDYIGIHSNMVAPTPTDWLAKKIVENIDAVIDCPEKIFSVCPLKPIPIRTVAKVMFEQVANIQDQKFGSKGFDHARPLSPIMDFNLAHDEENDSTIRLLAERILFYRDLFQTSHPKLSQCLKDQESQQIEDQQCTQQNDSAKE